MKPDTLRTALQAVRSDREILLIEYELIEDRILRIETEINGLELAIVRYTKNFERSEEVSDEH